MLGITRGSDRCHIGRSSPGEKIRRLSGGQAHGWYIMSLTGTVKPSRAGEKLNISMVGAEEQEQRIHAAVARRAFEIFQKRGTGAHEEEDWRQAEATLLKSVCIGRMVVEGGLWVSVDASHFYEGTINIWVAPRRMTISGKPNSRLQSAEGAPGTPIREEEIMFREVQLPVEVDPSNVTACINGKFLEIRLKNAQASPGQFMHQAAA